MHLPERRPEDLPGVVEDVPELTLDVLARPEPVGDGLERDAGGRVQQEGLTNVRTILGTPTDPRLPGGLDAVLIVDAYREMDEPSRPQVIQGLLLKIGGALKSQGRVGIVDFLPGGGGPGPAAEDRVKPETIIATVEGAGLHLQGRETIPPFQYLLVFGRSSASPRPTTSN